MANIKGIGWGSNLSQVGKLAPTTLPTPCRTLGSRVVCPKPGTVTEKACLRWRVNSTDDVGNRTATHTAQILAIYFFFLSFKMEKTSSIRCMRNAHEISNIKPQITKYLGKIVEISNQNEWAERISLRESNMVQRHNSIRRNRM